jgi:16S rRNA C1402 (ribose-2'-O) methylase RsmI
MSDDTAEIPAFSRVSRTGDELGELRVNSPRYVLAVVDSVAISETKASGKMVSRTDIVNRILSQFAQNKIDEASLINKALSENPTLLDGNK